MIKNLLNIIYVKGFQEDNREFKAEAYIIVLQGGNKGVR